MKILRHSLYACLICTTFIVTYAFAQAPIQDGLIGVVTKSNERKASEQFVFANMTTTRPFVTFPSGHGGESNKVFEDDELVVLFYAAEITGSTETFYLNKKSKRFTLIEVGALEARVINKEIKPTITFGVLK